MQSILMHDAEELRRQLKRMLLILGTGNGERGTGNGERGTGNREQESAN